MESFQRNDGCFRRLIVTEALIFRVVDIDPDLEGKLDKMFKGIIAIGDKAWAPFLDILLSDLFEDDDNATPEENEQNAIDDVRHNIDGNP
ncbi:L10-interacting MYB domain-containing protein-like [Gossypium australe]|uniref:L10-interacting MYB domain-containing protein-like n=1 Tax=Gossypium australe TaxID=47621 RepID=A0A5B6URZ2_9ROSI|nr:L10-interacting MYB domain-containing protein-like [Gossypium australe]